MLSEGDANADDNLTKSTINSSKDIMFEKPAAPNTTIAATNNNSTNSNSHNHGIDQCMDGITNLQISECSSISSESELSFAFDGELQRVSSDCEEMPSFEIRLISPLGSTPSPIDKYLSVDIDDDDEDENYNGEGMATPTRAIIEAHLNHMCHNNPEFVALHELNAQISPPNDNSNNETNEQTLSRSSSLETIFEGVFLNTPPRQKLSSSRRGTPLRGQLRSRGNLLEQVAINRLQAGKESLSPAQQQLSPDLDKTPTQLSNCAKEQQYDKENINFGSDLT